MKESTDLLFGTGQRGDGAEIEQRLLDLDRGNERLHGEGNGHRLAAPEVELDFARNLAPLPVEETDLDDLRLVGAQLALHGLDLAERRQFRVDVEHARELLLVAQLDLRLDALADGDHAEIDVFLDHQALALLRKAQALQDHVGPVFHFEAETLLVHLLALNVGLRRGRVKNGALQRGPLLDDALLRRNGENLLVGEDPLEVRTRVA